MEPQTGKTQLADSLDSIGRFQNDFGAIWGDIAMESVRTNQAFGCVDSSLLSSLRLNRITLRSLSFRRLAPAQDKRHDPSFAVLAFPISGKATIFRGDDEFAFSPGLAFFVRHGEPDLTIVPDHYDTFNVQVPLQLLEKRAHEIPYVRNLPVAPGSTARVFQHFVAGLNSELPLLEQADAPMLAEQVCDMLAMLLNRSRQPSDSETSSLRAHRRRILRDLEAMIAEQDLTPSLVARRMRVSVSHLHRIFAAGGSSVMAEVRTLRVERARLMLASSRHRHLQVAEVGYQCGFRSPQDFARVFRQHFGMSPSRFRVTEINAG